MTRATVTVKVEGMSEVKAALEQLPKATQKNVLLRVLKKRAQPIADAMQAKAPDDPDTHGNDLRSSIGVGTKLSPRQRAGHRKEFKNDKAAAEVFVGAGPLPQAHLTEFGYEDVPPNPWARPAWDANKGALLPGIAEDLWREIEAAAQRAARKAARQLARGGGGG